MAAAEGGLMLRKLFCYWLWFADWVRYSYEAAYEDVHGRVRDEV
jgi:hypothetical protein